MLDLFDLIDLLEWFGANVLVIFSSFYLLMNLFLELEELVLFN